MRQGYQQVLPMPGGIGTRALGLLSDELNTSSTPSSRISNDHRPIASDGRTTSTVILAPVPEV